MKYLVMRFDYLTETLRKLHQRMLYFSSLTSVAFLLVSIPCTNMNAKSYAPFIDQSTVEYSVSSQDLRTLNLNIRTYFKVTGTVTGDDGMPLAGVCVVVQDTRQGAVTDMDGHYIIDVATESDIIEFSCAGYQTIEKIIGNQRVVDVILKEEILRINDVVVTALGIKKEGKSLAYATQQIRGEELRRVKDVNLMNSLIGKVAGMHISQSSAGLGGAVKVRIRGSRSVTGSNQPLYVIDGIPVNSTLKDFTVSSLGGMYDVQNRDGGDGISNYNPDDIESINVLKGPAAAALYGSSAANGAVLITTKRGDTGRANLTLNTSTMWEKAAYGIPKFQDLYGGMSSCWGDEISEKANYANKFFRTGLSTINSLSLSTGTESLQSYFSYANTYNRGLIEGSDLNKHNFTLHETAFLFDNRFQIDANVNFIYQKVMNRPTPGGFYMNPLVGLYKFPRGGAVEGGESFDYYKDNYQIVDSGRNLFTQNWYKPSTSFEQNPFWLTQCTMNEDKRHRVIGNLKLSYQLNSFFSIHARGHVDFLSDTYEAKYKAGTNASLVGLNGRFISDSNNQLTAYADAMMVYGQNFRNISLHAIMGASIKDISGKSIGFDSRTHLFNPNIFVVGNVDLSNGAPFLKKYQQQEQAVFLAGQIGIKNLAYLDISARNDWTSTLAFTKYKNKGFFYPSVSGAWIISNCFPKPRWVSMAKIRVAWSLVGNGLPNYLSYPLNSIGHGGTIDFTSKAPFSELKPERTSSVEVGTEWRFFNNMLGLDVTYYQSRTRNQLFTLKAPAGSKYTYYYVNAGDIKNEGVEAIVTANPIQTKNFKWFSTVNFSLNRNSVVKLVEGMSYFNVTQAGTTNSYVMRLEKGGSFGDIYGRKFLRDEDGMYIYNAEGMPIIDQSDLKKVGNVNPDFQMSWQNTFTIKDFTLSFLIDGSFGGNVMSLTQAELDKCGVSKLSGQVRQQGGVFFDNHIIDDSELFYTTVGGRDGISENYVYDATNIRLRELSVSYSLPARWLSHQSVFKEVYLSLIGRNLFFFTNRAPFDPGSTLSIGNDLQGLDVFNMPTTRSLGFNFRVKF